MKVLRYILLPFSVLYGGIVWLRNKAFDLEILNSKSYDFPVICVGNLSVGGTGKSPMVEYLIQLFHSKYRVATLSRGYKRESKGFYLLKGSETATQVGDEPLQFKTKFNGINVAVDEDRQHGIAELQKLKPSPEIIVLDDAFQHRKVNPGFSIVLTAYGDLYANDFMLPTGNLREPKRGANRANILVVTKCPEDLSTEEQTRITSILKPKTYQSVYFTKIEYAHKVTNSDLDIDVKDLKKFTLVTGIANPKPLVQKLKKQNLDFDHLKFPDHHNFSAKELKNLNQQQLIVTTEKDFMRLKGKISSDKLFHLPIHIVFLSKQEQFKQEVSDYLLGSLL